MSEKIIWSVGYDGLGDKLDEIVVFLKAQQPFNTTWSSDYFKSKLIDNSNSNNGYLFYAEAENKIIGVASLTKKIGILNGKNCVIAEVGDTFVSRAAQRRGAPSTSFDPSLASNHYINKSIFGRLISELLIAAKKDGVSLVYGTPNSQSFPGYTKQLGFFEEKFHNNCTFYRPRVQGAILEFSFLSRFKRGLFHMETFFDYLNSYLFVSFFGLSSEFISEPRVISGEIEDLWAKTSSGIGFGLQRDASYWQKRYSPEMGKGYLFLALRNKTGSLVGLVVLRLLKTSRSRRGLAIVEWMGSEKINVSSVIAAAIYKMGRTECYTHVYIWSGNRLSNDKIRLRFGLFFLKKNTPIIFRNLSPFDIQCSNKFVFHLGSTDAV
ncbi:hypothetical protein OAW66_01330 [Alphaproteobacteria bacterium]|nr:hypothetical protein [Alphaproteobacteria bacterium]